MTTDEQIAEDIAEYGSNPLACVAYSFPWGEPGPLEGVAGPRDWQADILNEIGTHLRGPNRYQPLKIAIASGHGVGKTALIAMVTHWGMSTCDDCRVLVTANTEDQLTTKTWPEITKWFNMALNRNWWHMSATRVTSTQAGHQNTWRMDRETWSENNTEAFQGLHNLGKRIIVVFDEGSAIPKIIWDVAEGALTDEDTEIIFLVFGNPTQNGTPFANCFGAQKHRWVTRHIDARTVPGTNKVQIQKWIEDYGEDSDFVRVRVRGEFPRGGTGQFIPQDVVAEARKRKLAPSAYAHHWRVLVCDVARFGDYRTVIGERQGPKFSVLDAMRGKSTVETARQLKFRSFERDPRTVVIDGDGVGGGVVDWIRADTEIQKWLAKNPARKITEFHGGLAPLDAFMYFNLRANMWGAMRDWLPTADIPDDPEMETDLTGPEYFFSSKNQIQLERKEDMKKRGLASPDFGDTLAMSFVARTAGKTQAERDADRLAAAAPGQDRALLQYRLTLEREAQLERAEQRRPAHWE